MRGDPCSGHHTLLAFSFEAAGRTELMRLTGNSISQVQLPGLDDGSASLLLVGCPGGWLVQVTAHGVKSLPAEDGKQSAAAAAAAARAAGHTWMPPAGEHAWNSVWGVFSIVQLAGCVGWDCLAAAGGL